MRCSVVMRSRGVRKPRSVPTRVAVLLSAASSAAEGERIDIWFDAEQVQVFDPSSGRNLTA